MYWGSVSCPCSHWGGLRDIRKGCVMHNLIDWHVECKVTEARGRWEAKAAFIDNAGMTLAVSLLPWWILLLLMHP